MTTATSSIQVIDRSVRLLDAIATHPEPASLKVLAAETGLHPSTAFRILGAMADNGLVERDVAGRYVLGKKLSQLAQRVPRGTDLREEALPVMQALRDQVGETVNLTVREGDEVIYIERATPQRMMRVEQVIGSRAPLHVTAVGKLMLAELGETFLKSYAKRTGLKAYTRHTFSSVKRLAEEARKVQKKGFAYDDEEAEEGVGCIGVLIHGSSGAVVAGLSISAPMERRRDEWVPLLKHAGIEISQRLGYRGNK